VFNGFQSFISSSSNGFKVGVCVVTPPLIGGRSIVMSVSVCL